MRGGDGSRREVALTFDAGSDAGSTARILDVLAARDVDATFGITGRFAERNPDLVRRIAADGHVVMNHTYDHASFTGYSTGAGALSEGERLDELRRADAVIGPLIGRSTQPWFRPPYGDTDAGVDELLGRAGYRYDVLWTIDSLGWQGSPVDDVVDRCLTRAAPGAIYLFHVGSASTDVDALERVIDGLRADGYAFVTVAQMVR
ncbi:MAG TPA: polysaccharide deacetylase family protein [Acidimicrobiia bacterium]|nr:polysaccharide deacetylase family protein [Acidimicrobiia bacterium]